MIVIVSLFEEPNKRKAGSIERGGGREVAKLEMRSTGDEQSLDGRSSRLKDGGNSPGTPN